MKILYITMTPLEYNSSANMRNNSMINGLIENGHEIYTLSCEFDKDSIYTDRSFKISNIKKRYWIRVPEIHKSISNEIKNKKSLKYKIKNFIYNIYIKLSIYDPKKVLIKSWKVNDIKEKFDIIISSSDPKSSHLIAEKLIDSIPDITKKWIQYWGDPFMADINKKTLIPKSFIKKEEKRLIKKCDKAIYVSPFTLEKQKILYDELKDKMLFYPIPYSNYKVYNEEIANENIVLGYFGDYNSYDRNIIPLYNAIKNNDKIDLNICGNSNLKLKSKKNIKIKGRQKIGVIENLQGISNILICICNKKGTQIPGKIYHYAATNKPILIILDGERKEDLKKYFESFNRFELCYNNEADILNKIYQIIKENKKYIPCDKLNSVNIAKEFLKGV